MTQAWLDLRKTPDGSYDAVRQAGVHARVAAVVDADPDRMGELPPTVLGVYAGPDVQRWYEAAEPPDPAEFGAEALLLPVRTSAELDRLSAGGDGLVAAIDVVDEASLALACRSASSRPRTVVSFADPTKIPLEIVIAAADKRSGELVCAVAEPRGGGDRARRAGDRAPRRSSAPRRRSARSRTDQAVLQPTAWNRWS